MKRKIISSMLIVVFIVMSLNTMCFANDSKGITFIENSQKGNINAYQTISLKSQSINVYVGQVQAGKILIVSAIPTYGGLASTYVASISISPSVNTVRGGWYSDSMMTYFKIQSTGNYTLTITPTGNTNVNSGTSVDIYMYTVDAVNGFSHLDGIEGTSGNRNYVISNMPEHFVGSRQSLKIKTADSIGEEYWYTKDSLCKTKLIDGTERYLPNRTEKVFVSKDKRANQTISKDIEVIVEKINNNENLSIGEVDKYYKYLKDQNLTVVSSLSSVNTSQLGEYGYYLSRSRINGNANVYWEHVNQFGLGMVFGILLENKGATDIKVSLNKRSFDDLESSDKDALNNVWYDYFVATKKNDLSDLPTSGTLTIPANSARWVSLYNITGDTGYNIINGQLSISLKNTSGTTYTGSNVYCYSFVMSDWTNPLGQTMYQTVKANIGNGNFTRAAGVPSNNIQSHISGGGNGARLVKSFDSIIDITNDRYSFILTGFDSPYLNTNERISIVHLGPTSDGSYSGGYAINNCNNYGVVYKLSFAGFNTTQTGKNIKFKLKFNGLSNPGAAVNSSNGAVYATVASGDLASAPYTVKIGGPSSPYYSTKTIPWTVPKNTPFDLYLVVSGMSTMPLEVEFFEQ